MSGDVQGYSSAVVLERLATARILLVATDFDGVLAPIVADPDAVEPNARALAALLRLTRSRRTYVSVVSGRRRTELVRLLGHIRGLYVTGSYGLEPDPRLGADFGAPAVPVSLHETGDRLRALLSQIPGIRLESKPRGIAVHFRSVPAESKQDAIRITHDEARRIEERFVTRDPAGSRHIVEGLEMIEFLDSPVTKGETLAALRTRLGATAVLFVGDDVSDETVFATLKADDIGVKVGLGATLARQRVADVAEAAELLEALASLRETEVMRNRLFPIESHSMISDQRTVALLNPAGSVVWFPAPRIDSPAIFSSLLGGPSAGHFSIETSTPAESKQQYIEDGMVLRTVVGDLQILDYLDCSGGRAYQRAGRTDLVRVLTGRGRVRVRFAPRLDFGRVATMLRLIPGGIALVGAADPVVLSAGDARFKIVDEPPHQSAVAEIDLDRGPCILELRMGAALASPLPASEEERRRGTIAHWKSWSASLRLPSLHRNLVLRSALVIKSLCYGPSGAICAAASTSLPEQLGGVRNWDYRYCWIRDAAWSCAALVRLGTVGHAMRFLDWLLEVLDKQDSPDRLRPLYSVSGRQLGPEGAISELAGYDLSSPVRVGNGAALQVQLDVFGTVAELIWLIAKSGAPVTPDHLRVLAAMTAAVAARWHEPDHGIWEVRETPRHHTASKIMCWYTLDRAIATSELLGLPTRDGDLALRGTIAADIFAHGVCPRRGCFVGTYEGQAADAATLLAGLTGLLAPDDPRLAATVDVVWNELREGAAVFRYRESDSLPGVEGGFWICTGWLAECLAILGRKDQALALVNEMASSAGPTGLLPEQFDPNLQTGLGNHPQAYSHLALINACVRLARSDR